MSEKEKQELPKAPEAPRAEAAKPVETKDAPKKKDNTLKIVLIIVGVLVGLVVLFWVVIVVIIGSVFHRAAKNVQVNGTGKNGSVTVKSNDGQSTSTYGSNVALPKDFPSDLPIYKPSTLVSASATTGKHYGASAKTNSSVTTVLDYYRSEMTKQGWTSINESSFSDGTILSYKKDKTSATVSVTNQKSEATEKTWISISSSVIDY